MKKVLTIILCVFACNWFDANAQIQAPLSTSNKAKMLMEKYPDMPLYFIQNKGQINSKYLFYEKNAFSGTYFAADGIYIALHKLQGKVVPKLHTNKFFFQENKASLQTSFIKLTMPGMNDQVDIIPEDQVDMKVNYLKGSSKESWKTDIPAFSAIRYNNVYPGIDIRFYGNNRQLEYDVIVKPGADPSVVQFQYQGIENLEVCSDGRLKITLAENQSIYQKKLFIYQTINGEKIQIEGHFNQISASDLPEKNQYTYSFHIDSFNPEYALTIDPVMVFSTYFGGTSIDIGGAVAVDKTGNIYLSGMTTSLDLPATESFVNHQQDIDINGEWNAVISDNWAYGCDPGIDQTFAVTLNQNVNNITLSIGDFLYSGEYNAPYFVVSTNYYNNYVYINETISLSIQSNKLISGTVAWESTDGINSCYGGSNITLSRTIEESINWDIFISKFSPDGKRLIYCTLIGGNGQDSPEQIITDDYNNIYVTGNTESTNFPTLNALQSANAGYFDAFVFKLDSSGQEFYFSTYLGGNDNETSNAVDLDNDGNMYIAGQTFSTNFPTYNAMKSFHSGDDSEIWVSKINVTSLSKKYATKLSLNYSTYIGGSSDDACSCIDVDSQGNLFIAGDTSSFDMPTKNAFDSFHNGGEDCFIAKINSFGTDFKFMTYIGGSGNDNTNAIQLGTTGNIYLVGETDSSDFPLKNQFQSTNGGRIDSFIFKLNSDGNKNLFSTYFGGTYNDAVNDIVVDDTDTCYLIGIISKPEGVLFPESGFPVQNPLQESFAGGDNDCFITVFQNNNNTPIFSSFMGGELSEFCFFIDLDHEKNIIVTGSSTSSDFPVQNAYQQSYKGYSDAILVKMKFNQPPDKASSPYPSNNSTNISTDSILSWTGNDPDSFLLTYNIYFGTSTTPPLKTSNQITSIFYPGELLSNTWYYWKIETKDAYGVTTEGDIWKFKTEYIDTVAPSSPENVQSTTPIKSWRQSNTINITWNVGNDSNGSGVAGYSFLWDTSATTDPNITVDTTNTHTTKQNLTDGNRHYFHIRTIDNASNASNTIHMGPFYIDKTPPQPPENPHSSSHQTNVCSQNKTIYVSWNKPLGDLSGVNGFSVVWDQSSTTLPPKEVTVEEPSVIQELADHQQHYIHVRSVDTAGNWSTTAMHYGPFCIKTNINKPPDKASSPNPSNNSTNISTNTTLSWTGNDPDGDSLTYNIYFGTSSTPPLKTTNQSSRFYNPGNLLSDTWYYWKIETKDAYDITTEGDIWKFKTKYIDTVAPSSPANVQSTTPIKTWGKSDTIDMTWNEGTDPNGSGVAGYSFIWDTSPTTDPNITVETTNTHTTKRNLTDGNSHYFHIRTIDNANNASNTIHMGPYFIDKTPPQAPYNPLSSSHQTSVCSQNNAVSVSWNKPSGDLSGVAGYSILWDQQATTLPPKQISGSQITTTQILANHQKHYIHVRSVDAAGNWSNSAMHYGPFCIETAIPVPQGLAVSSRNSNSISFQWNKVSNQATYRLYRSDSKNGFYIHIGPYNISETSFTDRHLNHTTYWYKISACDASKESDLSPPIKAETDSKDAFEIIAINEYEEQFAGSKVNYIIGVQPELNFDMRRIQLNLINTQKWMLTPTLSKSSGTPQFWTTVSFHILMNENTAYQPFKVVGIGNVQREKELFIKVVNPNDQNLSLHVQTDTIQMNNQVSVYGKILPAKAQEKITLFYKHEAESVYGTVDTQTKADGSYQCSFRPDKVGNYKIYSKSQNLNSDSQTIFAQRGVSHLTLSVSDTSNSSDYTIIGMLAQGLPNEDIRIRFILDDQSFTELTVKTNQHGQFEYIFHPSKPDRYTIQSCWKGNSNYVGTVSQARVIGNMIGQALVIAGDTNDALENDVLFLADLFYKTLIDHQYTKDSVYYIAKKHNSLSGIVIDNTTPSKTAIQQYLDSLSNGQQNRWVDSNNPLLIYMINHGSKDKFLLNDQEMLDAHELDQWLDALQLKTGCQVQVIIDACYSGTFVDNLMPDNQQRRIVMTSTNNSGISLYNQDGRESFSYFLINEIRKGYNLEVSFENTIEILNKKVLFSDQNPQISDPGQLADLTYIGAGILFGDESPVITSHTISQIIGSGQYPIYAEINHLHQLKRVWATIIPPYFSLSDTSADTFSVHLPSIDLSLTNNNHYENVYAHFIIDGIYTISIVAQDTLDNISTQEFILCVENGLSADRFCDLDLDGQMSLRDAIVAIQLTSNIKKSIMNNLIYADINKDKKIGLPEALFILKTISH